HLQRPEHAKNAGSTLVQILPDSVFQERYIIDSFHLGVTNQINESPDRLRCVASAAQTAQRWHTRIVPSADHSVLDQLEQFALAHDSIGQVQAVEFNLAGPVIIRLQLVNKPVVKRPVNLE